MTKRLQKTVKVDTNSAVVAAGDVCVAASRGMEKRALADGLTETLGSQSGEEELD